MTKGRGTCPADCPRPAVQAGSLLPSERPRSDAAGPLRSYLATARCPAFTSLRGPAMTSMADGRRGTPAEAATRLRDAAKQAVSATKCFFACTLCIAKSFALHSLRRIPAPAGHVSAHAQFPMARAAFSVTLGRHAPASLSGPHLAGQPWPGEGAPQPGAGRQDTAAPPAVPAPRTKLAWPRA